MDSKRSKPNHGKAIISHRRSRKSIQNKSLSSNNFETILEKCRVCLNQGDISIFGDEAIGDLSESLKVYGGIDIQEDDNFPKFLCHACHEQLQSAIKFKETAQDTERYLKLLTNEEPDILSGHLDIDEEEIFKETLADINTSYHCSACDVDLTSSTEYGLHMFTDDHVNLKDKCPFCCREYSCIQKHLACHVRFSTVKCDICNGKFVKPNYFRHRSSHTDVLSFECPECPYRGRHAGDFKIHMRKHTGERPYQCTDCSAAFINKSNLNRHILTHKNDYSFQCDECTKGFYNKNELDLHIKVIHCGVKDHLCSICGKAFGYRKALMRHLLKVHKRPKLRSGKMPVFMKLKKQENTNTNELQYYDVS